MTQWAFSSTSACPMPPIPIIDVDLIQDCDVPEAPDPIWEGPQVPPPVPPELSIGCPPIEIDTTVRVDQDDPSFSVKFDPSYDDEDKCFPKLTFDVAFPRAGAGGGALGCFSIRKIGAGNVVGDIKGSVIECETYQSIAPGSSVADTGLLLELEMKNIQGGGGAACGCYIAVYCASSSSCTSLHSVGARDRDQAVSSISSMTDAWEISDDYECLRFDSLTRLVYNRKDLNMYAYYRTFCIDFTGRVTQVKEETRYKMQRINVVSKHYQVTQVLPVGGGDFKLFVKPVNADGTLSGDDVEVVVVDYP